MGYQGKTRVITNLNYEIDWINASKKTARKSWEMQDANSCCPGAGAAQLCSHCWLWPYQREPGWMELWGKEIYPMDGRIWLAQSHSLMKHPKLRATRQVHLIAHLIFHENRYRLLLLCLSLELSPWPSGISLGFWCRAWGWCGSPAWMVEEMSDFHLYSTLEIKKGRQCIRGYALCIVPNRCP